MAIFSSFFNSVGGDRKYKAEDWAAYFGKFIGNGFFADYLSALQITAGSAMAITVRPGACFINGYMMENTDDYTLTIDTADGILSRVDRVVVRWSLTDRNIMPVVKKGTPSASPVAPALQRDAEAWELSLATVTVEAGVLSIANTNIHDTRLDATVCGAVTGLIDQIDMAEFAIQYREMLEQLRETLANVQEGSAWVMKTGDTMTGEPFMEKPLGLGSGGTGANTAAAARTKLDVYSKTEVQNLLAAIADYDSEVFSWTVEA